MTLLEGILLFAIFVVSPLLAGYLDHREYNRKAERGEDNSWP